MKSICSLWSVRRLAHCTAVTSLCLLLPLINSLPSELLCVRKFFFPLCSDCLNSLYIFSPVQPLSHVQRFATPWTIAHQASLSISKSWSLLKLMSIPSVMPSNHLILSSPSPPAFNLSQHQGLFKWVSSSHQVAKVLEVQLQHQSFQWIFRTNFL